MVDACRGKSALDLPDVLHGRNMCAVIAAAYEAATTGKAVDVQWRDAGEERPD
jgi:hypothetical protein